MTPSYDDDCCVGCHEFELKPLEQKTVVADIDDAKLGVTYKRDIIAKLASLPEDMPLFLVLAVDVLGPETVLNWCHAARRVAVGDEKIASAEATANAMEEWQIQNTKHIPG